ncbi:hypothetical protein [Bacillus cereus]|uniref:hypothetical protein n=1 Tax=Bacillus cereus TaxID=1396 RepID=UPI00187A8342|nr:hypothetical protein [Bacillus cereus]MBE7099681.1 hypothetical protein [Bacillus cereus]
MTFEQMKLLLKTYGLLILKRYYIFKFKREKQDKYERISPALVISKERKIHMKFKPDALAEFHMDINLVKDGKIANDLALLFLKELELKKIKVDKTRYTDYSMQVSRIMLLKVIRILRKEMKIQYLDSETYSRMSLEQLEHLKEKVNNSHLDVLIIEKKVEIKRQIKARLRLIPLDNLHTLYKQIKSGEVEEKKRAATIINRTTKKVEVATTSVYM